MHRPTPNLERMFAQFQSRPGLFILGAGASAGEVPMAGRMLADIALDYLRKVGGFSPQIPAHSNLIQQVIDAGRLLTPQDVFPWIMARPGADDPPLREMLERLPGWYVWLSAMRALALPRYLRRSSHNYEVFRYFHPSFLLNFNHDGLAGDICGDRHAVRTTHGTVEAGLGSPEVAEVIDDLRDEDLEAPPDEVAFLVEERREGSELWSALSEASRFPAEHVALVGYSFWRDGDIYRDTVSLGWFRHTFRGFGGDVYIIDPFPDQLHDMVSSATGSLRVHAVRSYWNVLSHAMILKACGRDLDRSLNYNCQHILDRRASGVAYPLEG